MELFFVLPEDISGSLLYLRKEETYRLKEVLRYRQGDKVSAFDGDGSLYHGIIDNIEKDNVKVRILKKEKAERPLNKIILAQAIPGKQNMDSIVEKATELGADIIIPLITSRTVSCPLKDKQTQFIGRWRKIALEAAKQSKRLFLPSIDEVRDFKEALRLVPCESSILIPHLGRETVELKKIEWNKFKKNIFVFIGPEDDFSEEEISAAEKMGAIPVSLGKNVLKVETAAYYALSVLKHELNRH